MAQRSRCQVRTLGDAVGSFMTGLLEATGLVKPGQESAEQVAELLPVVLGQPGPQRDWAPARTRRFGPGQARGGAVCCAVVSMRSLRVIRSDVGDTRRPAQAAPRR